MRLRLFTMTLQCPHLSNESPSIVQAMTLHVQAMTLQSFVLGARVSCPDIFSIACPKIKWFWPNITCIFCPKMAI